MKILVFASVILLSIPSFGANDFLSLFKNKKPIIAALMVEGDLSTPQKVANATEWSLKQLAIAENHGMDGVLFEFRGGKILTPAITKEHYDGMLAVSNALMKKATTAVIGVEILWHYPEETLKLAKDSGAKFVRVDFFADEVIASGQSKPVPIDPEGLLKYRKSIGAEKVALLTDIQVKYSKMVNPNISLAQSASLAEKKGSDGVIVSGTKSGSAPSAKRPMLAQSGTKTIPVVIGSGFSIKNADMLLDHADAAIVGTSISVKTGGPLLPKKVDSLMSLVKSIRAK